MDTVDPLILQLTRIADALERLANHGKPSAPDIVRPISQYAGFDWSTIGAEIVQSDHDGPTHVSHQGRLFTRRSPSNKFEPAIWYSSPAGKDDEGNVQYLRLITFKTIADAESLPSKLAGELKPNGNGTKPPANPGPASAQVGALNAQATAEKIVQSYREQAAKGGLSSQAAEAILEAAGNDPLAAAAHLPYFKAAKAAGLNFSDAQALFVRSGSDVQFALKALPAKKE